MVLQNTNKFPYKYPFETIILLVIYSGTEKQT
jgi:hypothetical protein